MENFAEILELVSDLQLTTKDGKSIKTALLAFVNDFPQKMLSMLTEMKNEITDTCMKKDDQIECLENKVIALTNKVDLLDEKLDEQEAYERKDTIILSGKNIPPSSPNENCPTLVSSLLRDKLNLVMPASEISVCHRLGAVSNSQRPDRRSIIVKFCRRDAKMNVLRSARRVKAEDFYANESLTPVRQSIAFALRKAKYAHQSIISGSTTLDGSVYVWVKPPNPSAPGARDIRHKINTLKKLEFFCQNALQRPSSNFLQSSRN